MYISIEVRNDLFICKQKIRVTFTLFTQNSLTNSKINTDFLIFFYFFEGGDLQWKKKNEKKRPFRMKEFLVG